MTVFVGSQQDLSGISNDLFKIKEMQSWNNLHRILNHYRIMTRKFKQQWRKFKQQWQTILSIQTTNNDLTSRIN